MTMIAILISLVIERTMESLRQYRSFAWFESYQQRLLGWLAQPFWQSPWGVLVIILPPVIITGWLDHGLSSLLLGLVSLLFNIAVLWYCIGPEDLDEQVDAYLAALEEDDHEKARVEAGRIIHGEVPSNLADIQTRLGESILVQANERVLAVIFWFVILGPMGAVLYRLTCYSARRSQLQNPEYLDAMQRLHNILAYVPAYLSALGYALAGSFDHAWHGWQRYQETVPDDWQQRSEHLLVTVGMGALRLEPVDIESASETPEVERPALDQTALHDHIKSVLALVWRTLVIWVVLIALATLLGLSA